MSQLRTRQILFSRAWVDLLQHVLASGFDYRAKETERAPVQAEINALDGPERGEIAAFCESRGHETLARALRDIGPKRVGIRLSVHRDCCAGDLLLLKDDQIALPAAYVQFGEYWERKGDLFHWGGRWGDSYHFSVTPDGVRK